MSRTLISRGLAVVFATFLMLGVAPGTASARPKDQHGRHHVELSGTWTDPGATVDGITGTPYPSKLTIALNGQTTTAGGFTGTSTYVLNVLWDAASKVSLGNGLETFQASIAHGSGHVTFRENVVVNSDGSEAVTGRIIAGDGVFAGARGAVSYVGTTDPSGSNPGTGTYRMWIDLAH